MTLIDTNTIKLKISLLHSTCCYFKTKQVFGVKNSVKNSDFAEIDYHVTNLELIEMYNKNVN